MAVVGPYIVSVLSGQIVSSAFTLSRAERTLAVLCSSHAPAEIRMEFALTSGTIPFERLYRGDGSGAQVSVVSGNGGWGIVRYIPTPFGRIAQTTATIEARKTKQIRLLWLL